MVRRWLFLVPLGAIALGLSNCSGVPVQQREPWRAQAELACLKAGKVREGAYVKLAKPLQGPGICGAEHPLRVSAFHGASAMPVALSIPATLTCPMVSAADRWVEEVVQPAAMARFGQRVSEVRSMGTYACRTMNNQRGARLSEHGYANAIDVGGFRLEDGRVITVKDGWKSGTEDANFLREVHAGGCRHFATVLGPGSDVFHYDHLHLDMARHGRGGDRSVCRPYPKPVPPPAPRDYYPDPARGGSVNAGLPPRPGAAPTTVARAAPPPYPSPRAPLPRPNDWPRDADLGGVPRPPAAMASAPGAPGRPAGGALGPAPRAAGPPVVLYAPGHGPFTPARPGEVDAGEFDLVTGSVGE